MDGGSKIYLKQHKSMTEDTTDDDTEQCGYPATNGPCQNPATGDDGYCWLDTHADDPADSEGDGRGAPEGNGNAVGNDGGAPPGNTRAAEHGLHMGIQRRLELFEEQGLLDLFESLFQRYREKAENPSEAASLASAAVIRDELEADLLKNGLFRPTKVGDPEDYKNPEDAFVEMPKKATIDAYTDALREVRLGKEYEGVTGNGDGAGPHGDVSTLWEG